jgi:hypothetical protein
MHTFEIILNKPNINDYIVCGCFALDTDTKCFLSACADLAEVAMVVGIMQTTLKYMEKINEWMLTN